MAKRRAQPVTCIGQYTAKAHAGRSHAIDLSERDVEGLTRDKTRRPGKQPLSTDTVQRVVVRPYPIFWNSRTQHRTILPMPPDQHHADG